MGFRFRVSLLLVIIFCPWQLESCYGQTLSTLIEKDTIINGTRTDRQIIHIDISNCSITEDHYVKRYTGSSSFELTYDNFSNLSFASGSRYLTMLDPQINQQSIIDTFWNSPYGSQINIIKMNTDSTLIIGTRNLIFEYNLLNGNERIFNQAEVNDPDQQGAALVFRNGKACYYSFDKQLRGFDPINPGNFQVLNKLNLHYGEFVGFAADVHSCDSINYYILHRDIGSTYKIYQYFFETNTLDTLCYFDEEYIVGLAAPNEYAGVNCHFFIDLDKDDNEGSKDWETNAGVTCPSESTYLVDDPWIRSFGIIDSLVLSINDEIDPGMEWLSGQSLGAITISQPSPERLILVNQGSATLEEFENSLATIQYQNTSLNPTQGNRTVSAIMHRGNKRSDSTFIYLNLQEAPVFTLGPDLNLCAGDTIILNPSDEFASFQWSTGINSNELLVTAPGIYWLEQQHLNGCVYQDSVEVTFEPTVNVDLGPDQYLCEGEELIIEAPGHTTYFWSTGSTADSILVGEPGIYWVAVDDGGDCMAIDTITFLAPLVNNYLSLTGPSEAITGATVSLTIDSEAITLSDYMVTPASGFIRIDGNQLIYSLTNSTTIYLSATDEYGCMLTTSFDIEAVGEDVFIPNIFSPDGNGFNDIFTPLSTTGNRIIRFQIFNRTGLLCYEITDVPMDGSQGWNGTSLSGNELSQGVYIYTIEVVYSTGKKERFDGDVLLVR